MLGFGLYAAMVAASALLHCYFWVRLVRDTTRPGTRARRWATGAVLFSGVLAPAARMLLPFLGPQNGRWLAWPGYLLIAVLLYLLTGLAMAELPRSYAALRIRRAERAAPAPAPTTEPVDRTVLGHGARGGRRQDHVPQDVLALAGREHGAGVQVFHGPSSLIGFRTR
ncbi:hypothetical protein AB0L74_33150 [Streptomyces sp. NPDC052020]|uniref:hypothetical protein n=1 Tax=Streptomyces sp. NPDC052020 TaxID=3155677 RepID=UPI003427B242